MRKKYITGTTMAALLVLTACTQGRESFSTEPGEGYGWKDMTQTQKKIHEETESLSSARSLSPDYIATSSPIILPDEQHVTVTPTPFLEGMDPAADIMRSPDKYMKIWFAPYQDDFGNLHENCVVHTIVKHGEWVIPNHALQMS